MKFIIVKFLTNPSSPMIGKDMKYQLNIITTKHNKGISLYVATLIFYVKYIKYELSYCIMNKS